MSQAPVISQLAIPATQARLQPYIQMYASQGGYDGTGPLPTLSQLRLVGAVSKIMFKSKRTVGNWRQLDANSFGKIMETYPNLTEYEFSFTRVMLYNSDALEELGWLGPDVIMQNRPLFLILILKSPNTAIAPEKAWGIFGTWMKEVGAEFDLTNDGGDMKILQEVPCGIAGVISL
jgi:hypothetical protein